MKEGVVSMVMVVVAVVVMDVEEVMVVLRERRGKVGERVLMVVKHNEKTWVVLLLIQGNCCMCSEGRAVA